jgi:hypothetical protein
MKPRGVSCSCGGLFVEVRKRGGVEMGKLVNTLRVMAKPLAAGTLPEYLALVARDRPEPREAR